MTNRSCQNSNLCVLIASQTGANAPTIDATPHNDLGEVLTFAYVAAGQYTITSAAGQFKVGKVVVSGNVGNGDGTFHSYRVSDNVLDYHTLALPGGAHTDGILTSGSIIIEIFP